MSKIGTAVLEQLETEEITIEELTEKGFNYEDSKYQR
jgi:hypothetical protein